MNSTKTTKSDISPLQLPQIPMLQAQILPEKTKESRAQLRAEALDILARATRLLEAAKELQGRLEAQIPSGPNAGSIAATQLTLGELQEFKASTEQLANSVLKMMDEAESLFSAMA